MNKSTLLDLNILSDNSENDSFLKRFDFTKNDNSRNKLKNILVGDALSSSEIKSRQEILKYVIANAEQLDLGINNSDLYYLNSYLAYEKVVRDNFFNKVIKFTTKSIKYRNHINIINSGVVSLIIFLHEKWQILRNLNLNNCPPELKEKIGSVTTFISLIGVDELIQLAIAGNIPFLKLMDLDYLVRVQRKETVMAIVDTLCELDALVSISKSVIKYNLVFPKISDTNTLKIQGVFHPFVKDCIKNDFEMNGSNNLYFLTGPNMSGKSTFLKSIGATVYLALRGIPVPAGEALVPLFDDVIVNINTQDDIFKGDSYFISELKKVKEVAVKLEQDQKCFVLFDELFRGTNFFDAKECSKLVIRGLSNFKSSMFVISTHIIELYKDLGDENSMKSIYLETFIKDGVPVFTHKLKPGISEVRLGMYLLENEGIKDLLFNKR